MNRGDLKRRAQETGGDSKEIRRGWCLGDQTFRRQFLDRMEGRVGEHQAERLVEEGLRKARWTDAELATRQKPDPVRIPLAARLREATTMTLKWIAARLRMGAWTHLNNRLHEHRRRGARR